MSILEQMKDPALLEQMGLGTKLWGSVTVMIIGMAACLVALTAIMYAIKLMHFIFREKKQSEAPAAPEAAAAAAAAPAAVDLSAFPAGSLVLSCPCEGTVRQLNAGVGASVRAGDVLLLLDAFNTVNEIVAPEDGVVREIRVSAGDRVSGGDALVVF